MPCLNLSTNVNLDGVDTSSILSEATSTVATIIGKPESLLLPQCRQLLKTFIIRLQVEDGGSLSWKSSLPAREQQWVQLLFGCCLPWAVEHGNDFPRDTILVFCNDLSANQMFWSKLFYISLCI